MRTGDQTLIKELNKSIITNLIRHKSPISRTQISHDSGLNKATVSTLTEELLDAGLVVELGSGHSTVGRRPRMLGFNATAGYTIGVELGVEYVRLLTMDLGGRIVSWSENPLSDTTDVQTVVSVLVNCIQKAANEVPKCELGIIGVGIGVPGLVDFSSGVVRYAPNFQWSNVPLKSYLEAHIQLPTFIDNEANVGALAEQLFGGGKQTDNFVYVSVGTGIGTGIIVSQNLIRGGRGTAGEFGHTVIESHGLRCSCGNRGCLEVYASEKTLVSKYNRATGSALSSEEILIRLREGDPAALQAIQTIGQYLGIGIGNIINALNPELVLIGNRLSEAGESLLSPVKQAVQNSVLKAHGLEVRVELASLGRNATATGAASLALNQYFQGPLS